MREFIELRSQKENHHDAEMRHESLISLLLISSNPNKRLNELVKISDGNELYRLAELLLWIMHTVG